MILDGFKTGNHSVFGLFSDPSKSGVLNPNSVFIQTMISCFKAIPSLFFSQKNDLLK